MSLEEKRAVLMEALRGYGRAAVAFSGGVDSSFLCAAAREALGEGALALTVVSPMLARSELEDARKLAAMIGIRHILVEEPDIDPEVAANPPVRCYLCKKREFGAMARAAAGEGVSILLDGTNVDDEGDYRPGMRALAELKIESPLRKAGLRKEEIRELSRRLGLPTWDKPAFACLASRLPYGERIEPALLSRIDGAEDALKARGLRQVRVRSHGDIARIEIAREERSKLFDGAVLDSVSAELKALGFRYVCLELEGYSMGSLNRRLGTMEGNA